MRPSGNDNMNRSSQREAPALQPLDIEVVKRHAKRLAEWTDLKTSEAQEVTARVYGASSWQALLKVREFSTDEDLSASLDTHENHRHKVQLAALADRLHIGEGLAETLLQYWQPTSALPTAPLLRRPAEDITLLAVVPVEEHRGDTSSKYILAIVLDERPPSDQALQLAVVRRDRCAIYMPPSDVSFVNPDAHGSKAVVNAWARLRKMPDSKRLELLAIALARPNALRLPANHAPPDDAAPAIRVTAHWLRERVPQVEVLHRFAAWKPWKREDFPELSRDKASFYCTTHNSWRFEVKALSSIHVVVYERGERFAHGDVAVGVGGLRFLEEGRRLFQVESPGFYLVKYDSQPHGRAIDGIDEDIAAAISRRIGLVRNGRYDDPAWGNFFQAEAGLAFASWIATPGSPGHKLLKKDPQDSYLGRWVSHAVARMKWELARAGRL